MKLQVGERLEGAGPAHQPGGYVITAVVRETPWHGLYAGKKIFYNFDFTAKRVRETDEVEWLDVFLRTNRYPKLDDPVYVQQRRSLARAEVHSILGHRHSNLWPEPVDLLDIENTRDPFPFADDAAPRGEPVVVYARPQGRFLPDWQQQVLPLSSILSVLAELLEFIKQAHAEGLQLLGLGPGSLLIDASDRVHYIGAEMVLPQDSDLFADEASEEAWRRLFPADRFARGVAAPECFDPKKRPDVRADLYAFGTLAYSLLTGIDASKVAQEQGRPWMTLDPAQWTQFEKALDQLPHSSLQGWAEQLGIAPQGLLADWPKRFLTTFRLLLSADRERRPGSAEELLAWLVDPPPPPIAGLLALHTDGDTAKLLLDCTGADMNQAMTIQCRCGKPARQASEGETVAEGPVQPVIGLNRLPVTPESIFYTVFTRRRHGDRVIHSPGVSAELWQPSDANLRHWVEEQAVGGLDGTAMPPRVAMLLGALDLRSSIEALLASRLPRVRTWGLQRLEQTVHAQGRIESAEPLLWRFVADANVAIRQRAAATLWWLHPRKDDETLLRLLEALESPPVDAAIPLAHFLRELPIPEPRIRHLLAQLETRRPIECPVCRTPLTLGARAGHLQSEHGYLVYQGDLLPAEAVRARLWERAFNQQDRQAHEELIGLYQNLPEARAHQAVAVESYVADMQRSVLGEAPDDGEESIPVALPYDALVAFQASLRHSKWFLPIAQQLLWSGRRRVRDFGCQTVLPFIEEQLRQRGTPAELRRWLGAFGGDIDHADVQIDLCRQLGQIGVDPALVNACMVELQDERLVACPECRAEVQAKDLELHLRRAHQVFEFRGVRGAYGEVREAMLRAIGTPPADVHAWRSLVSLAEDKHPSDAGRFLVTWLLQEIKEADQESRGNVMAAMAEALIAGGTVERLLPILVGPNKNVSWELVGQRLALEMCARLSGAKAEQAAPLILPFLDIKELPRRMRENAALALLRSLGKDASLAGAVLRAYVRNSSKKRGIEKLQLLEPRLGHSPALDLVCAELQNEIRMSCPRCPAELRRRDMVPHLWDQHRLLLEGERVREPWRVVEDWVVDYGLEKDPQVLQRCRELALRDDPNAGLARLQRMLYRHGLRDRELLNELRAQVKARKATLCPHCCTPVDMSDPPALPSLTATGSRLEGFGYELEVSERGLMPSLRIESPDAILFRGRDPGRWLTPLAGIPLLVGPLMAVAFLILHRAIHHDLATILAACVAVGVGLLGGGFAYLLWPSPPPARDRLIKAAWTLLVPRLLRGNMACREWGFLHGLVEISRDVRRPWPSEDLLLECCEEASEAAGADANALACLATLSRRCLTDMCNQKDDPFDFVLTLASECFKGKLPLSFLSDLLANFHGPLRARWEKRDLNRLQILIAHQACKAELEVDDWLNLGRALPVVNSVLGLDNRWHWLQFYAIWRQRQKKPWQSAGAASDMIELASAADPPENVEELLSFYPDVLLYSADANVVVGSKGVWIEGVCVTKLAGDANVSADRIAGGYEILVGALAIRCESNPLSHLDAMTHWLHWYFREFVPTVANAPRPMTESLHRAWQLGKLTCPECSRSLFPCPGDLGVPLASQ
jgi:hypothetical protein